MTPDRSEGPPGELGAAPGARGAGYLGTGRSRRTVGRGGDVGGAGAPDRGRRRDLSPRRRGTRPGRRGSARSGVGNLERARGHGRRRGAASHATALGQGALEALDALEESHGGIVCLGVGQLDQRHLEVDALVRDVPHVDLGPAQLLEAAYQGGQPHAPGGVLDPGAVRARQAHELARHDGEEPLAEVLGQIRSQTLGIAARLRCVRHRHDGPGGVAFGQGLRQLGEHLDVIVDDAARRHLVEGRERVAGRTPAPAHRGIEGLVGKGQSGGGPHLVEQGRERLGPEEAELEMLGAGADGGKHLLGVGGGQHEHDMAGGLLERLQQSVRGRRREHVHLVDDVDLPPARGAQRGMGDQIAHGVHAVVRGGVELVHVERRSPGDLDTGVATPTGLAVLERGAVQRLGQDAGRRGLPGTAWTAEEIRVPDAAVAHRVSQRQAHVFLAEHLFEALGAETTVERLVGSGVDVAGGGHRRSLPGGPGAPYRCDRRAGGHVPCRCSVRRPGLLRHTTGPAESCCLPALTRFTGDRCAGPGRRTEHRTMHRRR